MDKCYPVTTQRRRVRIGKKQAKAMAPKATGGLSGAAPKEETELRSQQEGEARPPGAEAAGCGPAVKEVAEEEAAGTPGWEENTEVQKEVAVHPSGRTARPPRGADGGRSLSRALGGERGGSPGSQAPRPPRTSPPPPASSLVGRHLRRACSAPACPPGPGEGSSLPGPHRACLPVPCRGLCGGERGAARGRGAPAPEEALAGLASSR
ncbi:uncharacterized protein LOC118539583 isoform X2 [Halichoerus grypus]